MKTTQNIFDLKDSIQDGYFTLDGRNAPAYTFYCSHKQLKSLNGGPLETKDDYDVSDNLLINLEGCAHTVGEHFMANKMRSLKSLKGGPSVVSGTYNCNACSLKTLDGVASRIGHSLIVRDNYITSLHNIHKQITEIGFNASHSMIDIDIRLNPVKECLLGVILLKNNANIILNTDLEKVANIINTYTGKGPAALYKAAGELISLHHPELAKL